MRSVKFPTSWIEAHLNHANKSYPWNHCYHRLRVKIFNFKISLAYQYPLRGLNRFCNLWGCKHFTQHLHHLQYFSLTHNIAWIQIQIHAFKNLQNIWTHLRFPKLGKHRRHPGKFNTVYAAPRVNSDKIYAPKQHINLSPTIYSTYHIISTSTISRGERTLLTPYYW